MRILRLIPYLLLLIVAVSPVIIAGLILPAI